MARNHGKNWQERITLEWHDNPPRENTKANNRLCRETRKALVRLAGSHKLDIERDIIESEGLALDAVSFASRLPRSLVKAICDTADERWGEEAGVIGVGYARVWRGKYTSTRGRSATGQACANRRTARDV